VNQRIGAQLSEASIPIVLVDHCICRYPERSRHDLVGIDNRRAGYRMTRHLLQNGCRRLAFAYWPGAAPTVEARQAGYREALWRHSISGELPLETDGTDIHIIERFIRSARPDGVVCANDLTAAKLMHNLLRLG